MTTNRYYKKEYDEEYYILDSKVISEKEFDEKLEYEGYKAFEDSLTTDEIISLLNNNEKLEYYKKENYHLKKRIAELEKEVDYKKNTDACRVISDFIDYKKDVTNLIDKELDYWYIQKDKGLISTCTTRVINVLKRIKKEL